MRGASFCLSVMAMGVFSVSLMAQTSQQAAPSAANKPAPAPVVNDDLTVLSDTSAKETDSPLVRAAKASRARAAKTKAVAVIDNTAVKKGGGTLSQSTYVPPPESLLNRSFDTVAAKTDEATATHPQPAKKKDDSASKLEELKKSQARLAAESEEVYPSDMDEDALAKRMHDLQQAIDSASQTPNDQSATPKPH